MHEVFFIEIPDGLICAIDFLLVRFCLLCVMSFMVVCVSVLSVSLVCLLCVFILCIFLLCFVLHMWRIKIVIIIIITRRHSVSAYICQYTIIL